MTDREVMQQALEALEVNVCSWDEKAKAMTALRAALAEPEPVAWYRDDWKYGRALLSPSNFYDGKPEAGSSWKPLYTAPPARQPLTPVEIAAMWRVACEKHSRGTTGELVRAFARAIERAHGIGGNDE